MIAESLSEGLLDPEEHNRLSRALRIRNRVVADVAVPLSEVRAVPVAADRSSRRWRRSSSALAETGYSRFPVADPTGRFIGYVHIKDVLPIVDDPDAVVEPTTVRPAAGGARDDAHCPTRSRCCGATTAIWRWSSTADGSVSAMVTLEDLVEDLVGTVRDGTHRA